MQNSATRKHFPLSRGTSHRTGQIAIFTVLLITIVVLFVTIITGTLMSNSAALRKATRASLALQLAESGVDKAVWCLNHSTSCAPGYAGETTPQGAGQFTTTLVQDGSKKTATSTGTVQGVTRAVQVTLENAASTNAQFFYGVQAGVGGIELDNNAKVIGNVYTSGSITGGNGSQITGDAILTPGSPTQDQVSDPPVSPLTTSDFGKASANQYLVQSFVPASADKVYSFDLKLAKVNSPTTSLTLFLYTDNGDKPGTNISGGGQRVTASVPSSSTAGWENGWVTQVFTPNTNTPLLAGTKYWLVIKVSNNNDSKYWRTVRGTNDTTYANGTAKMGSSASSVSPLCVGGCDIAFRVNMGGVPPTLKVTGGTGVGGSAWARTIDGTTIGKHAYYKNITGTVKANNGAETCSAGASGAYCHHNQEDQPQQNFPLSTSEIVQMEALAAGGGTVNCATECIIANGATIGPKKYVGDVKILNNSTVTLNGTVWVSGNLTIDNNSILKLSAGYGASSGVIIADDPANPATKGTVTLSNNGDLRGNGTADTYIMAIGMNADPTYETDAIAVSNNLTAGVVYAQYGAVNIGNNAGLKEVTAQKIELENNATITYESGLADVNFTSGPGGAWQIEEKTWQEVRE